MRLVTAVLGFVLSKAFLGAAIMVVLFLGYVAIEELQTAVEGRDRLEQVAEERDARSNELNALRSRYEKRREAAQGEVVRSQTRKLRETARELREDVADQKSKVRELEQVRDKACGLRGKVVDAITPGSSCDSARKAVAAAKSTLKTVETHLAKAGHAADVLNDPALTNGQKLDRLGLDADGLRDVAEKRRIENKSAELDRLADEEESLEEAQDSLAGSVVKQWDESQEGLLKQWAQVWKWLLGIVLVVLLAPAVLRTVGYFLLMPLVSRAQRPLQLAAGQEHAAAALHAGAAERTLPIRLAAGEVLSARSEYVRPVRGKARSQLLYDWRAPFISFAAGLHSLSRITGDTDGTEATLATPDDPNSYLMRIDFTDHPGVVMHPKHVVGVMGAPELETRWRWGIQSLATWQVRYILFAGTGSLIVQGSGDVVATSPGDRATKMEQHLMMGFDSRLTGGVNRTEVFWPYLRGKTPLVDDEFTGPYLLFWQKSSTGEHSTPIVKTFNAVFSGLGKLLGF